MLRKRQKAFTLIELIVAICIVAILLVLTLPAYQRQLQTTRRSLGSAELMDVMMRQEQYFLDHKQYAGTLTDLGYPASPYAIDTQGNAVSAHASDRIYAIEMAAQQFAYTLRAIPQLSQTEDRLCGTLSLASSGIRMATGEGPARECW